MAYGNSGNAEVSRTHNLQSFEMTPSVHPPGNASVSRRRNLQVFEMTPQMPHPPGNASVWRLRNLQVFEMTPTGPLSVTISAFVTTDQNGNAKSTFAPGNSVLFKIVVSSSCSQNIHNALVSVMVQTPTTEVLFLSYTFENVQVGLQTTIYLGLQIPYNAIVGEYTAKVNMLTMLPSQGGVPLLGGHAEITFTVG